MWFSISSILKYYLNEQVPDMKLIPMIFGDNTSLFDDFLDPQKYAKVTIRRIQ